MKAFDTKLLNFMRSQNTILHFLHCNTHILLGMSCGCETGLEMPEKEIVEARGSHLGRESLTKFKRFRKTDSATARLIRLTIDITGPRGDEKNGCRAKWMILSGKRHEKLHDKPPIKQV
jgi:hypothetical protein